MIPSPWVGLILALAAARLTRLTGWDDLPPIVRLRAWVTGEDLSRGPYVDGNHVVYKRPTLAHFIGCAYCAGFWWALATYSAWLWQPRVTLYVAMPLALSTAVGTWARRLDP